MPPLLVLSLAFLAGLLLPEWQPPDWRAPALAALALFLFGLLEGRLARRVTPLARWRAVAPLPLGLMLSALLAGNALAMASQPRFTELDAAWYNERGEVRLIGVIDRPPQKVDQLQRYPLRVERITRLYEGRSERNYPASGLVWVISPAWQELHYGDRVRLTGALTTPEDSYGEYLARKRIYATMRVYGGLRVMETGAGSPLLSGIYSLRDHAYAALVRSIPQPEASLLAGILLGIETDMPQNLKTAFVNTGTSHIIAISGFNIAILSGLFCSILLRFTPKLLAPFLAIFFLAAYTVLVGAQASVVRAAIMGSIGLVGQVLGRRQAGATTLVFTAAVMCAFNPAVIGDAGFLLSFTATLGLILYADPLKAWFVRHAQRVMPQPAAQRISGPVGEYFLFTAAAQVTTLPVILALFGRLSVSSALANPLILPAQPPVMVLGGIAVVAGMIAPPLGDVLAHLVTPLLAYTIQIVEWLGAPAWSSTAVGGFALWACVAYYLALFGLTIWRSRITALLGRARPPAVMSWGRSFLTSPGALLALLLLTLFAWRAAFSAPDGRLHLAVLPCGNNAVMYARSPGGQSVLVGGCEQTRDLSSALGRRLRPLYPRIDLLVVPNGDKTAAKGLADLADRITFGQALLEAPDVRANQSLGQALNRQRAAVHNPAAGQTFDLGRGVKMMVLAHDTTGTAVLIEYGSLRVLAPGGIEPAKLEKVEGALQPSLLVLSERDLNVAEADSWRRLEPLAIAATKRGDGENWLDLDSVRWVQAVSDGEKMWLEVERR